MCRLTTEGVLGFGETPDKILMKFDPSVVERYDFSGAVYRGAVNRIENLICPEHGVFSQYAYRLYKGFGCPKCGFAVISAKKRLTLGDFIVKAQAVHGDKYDYSKSNYKTAHKKVVIVCHEHGEFEQTPNNHIYCKKGCPVCRGEKTSVSLKKWNQTPAGQIKREAIHEKRMKGCADRLIGRATAIHGDLYDYSRVEYVGAKSKIEVVCPTHGSFWQIAEGHLSGQGCPSCNQSSRQELEILEYVKTFGHEVAHRDREVLRDYSRDVGKRGLELDIYVPSKMLAIEVCGLYWHSTLGKTKPEAKICHHQKYLGCKKHGIRLITVFEDEWRDRPAQVMDIIARALRAESAIYARKCSVVRLSYPREFYNHHHIQGAPRGGLHYGLMNNGELVACMTFTLGGSRRGSRGWDLLRYAASRRVVGGASRLLKQFTQDFHPDEIVSFSDNRYFNGEMYGKLGFVLDGEIKPDYSVVLPDGSRHHKTAFARKNIPARIRQLGVEDHFDPATDKRTEWQMIQLLGCGRIYDCGKKRWLWRAGSN